MDSPYHIRLDVFEGPLDLLLHLIKENEVDVYNIPISKITDQYLQHIDMMDSLNLEIAGEFLLMAATLAHIKSQMLLPPDDSLEDADDEGQDPRAELVRRLLVYQKYKDAADRLFARPMLDRDVFKRERYDLTGYRSEGPGELAEVSIFKLVEAFHRILQNFRVADAHEVEMEPVTISSRVEALLTAIRSSKEGTVRFDELFDGDSTRQQMITTFLAVLEMLKRGVLRVFQSEAFSGIELIGTPLLYNDWEYDGRTDYVGEQQAQI